MLKHYKGDIMTEWDSDAINNHLKSAAYFAENYLNQVRDKVEHNHSYEMLFDEYLAKFQIYGYLRDRTFLNNRECFIAELKSMLQCPHRPIDKTFDFERFMKFYKICINELLKDYEN